MAVDVIVVGGSYAGLSAAMQLARARRRLLIVDGGTPRNRFAHAGHGFLGQDGRPPLDTLREAAEQVLAYPTVEMVRDDVVATAAVDGGFGVTMASGRTARGARLVLATGVRDELPEIPGLRERWGVTVLHCPFCHGFEVADQPLGVLATGPMSPHQGVMIPDWGPTTYFTNGVWEPTEEEAAKLDARGAVIERSPIAELLGGDRSLEGVRLDDGRIVRVHAIFTGPRQLQASPFAELLGCALEDGPLGRYVRVDAKNETTVPGVYAAGDMAMPMANATLASASGVMAGSGAYQSLLMADIAARLAAA